MHVTGLHADKRDFTHNASRIDNSEKAYDRISTLLCSLACYAIVCMYGYKHFVTASVTFEHAYQMNILVACFDFKI